MSTHPSWLLIGTTFACGAATWTFLEYLIHNFLGHHGRGRNPFGAEHMKHHATTSYFAPTSKKAMAATPVLLLAWAGLSAGLGLAIGSAYAAGLAIMYVAYEVVHRRCHTHAPRGAYGRWMRLNHFHHHFLSPKTNHGVTTPIWDYVFGTHREAALPIRVPRKHAMTWLIDPATGRVHDAFAQDYVVVGRGAPEPPPAIEGVAVAATPG